VTEDVETRLRVALQEQVAHDGGEADPWLAYMSGRSHRRRRLVRRGAVALSCAAVATAGLFAVAPSVLDDHHKSVVAAPAQSSLYAAPPVGGLAGGAWAAALVDRFRTNDALSRDADGGVVEDRDMARVIFASDLGGVRVAMVVTPTSYHFLQGPTGAQPSQLLVREQGFGGLPESLTWIVNDGASNRLVVVAPGGARVDVAEDVHFGADGRTRLDWTAVAKAPTGEFLRRVTGDGPLSVRVRVEGRTVAETRIGPEGEQAPFLLTEGRLAAITAGTRGPSPVDAEFLERRLDSMSSGGIPVEDSDIRVLWSGSIRGVHTMLVTVQPPNGGVLVSAHRVTGSDGGSRTSRTDMHALLPAAGAYDRPLAWRLKGNNGDPTTTTVVVFAPAEAERVELTGSGSDGDVAIDGSGVGLVEVPLARDATVTAYDSNGGVVGRTPVFAATAYADLPGLTPDTRLGG
jgi:hypothetical protein